MISRDTYSSVFLKAAELDQDIEKIKSSWWYNLRNKHEGGLRLTDEGLQFIKEEAKLKTYEIEIPKEIKITAQILIWLDHYIKSPWHLQKHIITVISERSAFELYMFSGDVRKMGQAKAMAKNLEKLSSEIR